MAAVTTPQPGADITRPAAPARQLPRWAWPTVLAVIAPILFAAYWHQSLTIWVSSDGAAPAQQAWDMWHGNPLLHGWILSDVSFYLTELPQYLVIELWWGFSPAVVHIAAAMTYTLVVLGAAFLARGSAVGGAGATGREGVVRGLIAGGILLAPTLGLCTNVALSDPDHVGTQVVLLLGWLVFDRFRPGWRAVTAIAAILTWGQVADPMVLFEGVLPLLLVCAIRMCLARRPSRYEAALAGAAIGSALMADLILHLIREAGGFALNPVSAPFEPVTQMYHNLLMTTQSVLDLFGADFSGSSTGAQAAIPLLHLAGLALGCWAVARALRRFGSESLLAQVLAITVIILLALYLVRSQEFVGVSTHELAGVLVASAVLAGRQLAGPLSRSRHLVLVGAVLVGYAGILGHNALQPAIPDPHVRLTSWLQARGLRYGLAGYWTAGAVTIISGDTIGLRPVTYDGQRLTEMGWESRYSWYDPRRHDARFLVLQDGDGVPETADTSFGPPAARYRVACFTALDWHNTCFTVLIWHHNLLTQLGASRLPSSSAS